LKVQLSTQQILSIQNSHRLIELARQKANLRGPPATTASAAGWDGENNQSCASASHDRHMYLVDDYNLKFTTYIHLQRPI